MIKNVTKTLVLSLTVLAASTQAHASLDTARETTACATRSDVERGWQLQLELFEARRASRGSQELDVKGVIITPPFPDFAPYRTDLPAPLAHPARTGAVDAPGAGPQQSAAVKH